MSRAWAHSLLMVGSLCLAIGCGSDNKGGSSGGLEDEGNDDPTSERDASTKDAGKDTKPKDAGKDTKPDAKPRPDPVLPDASTCAAITKEAPVTRGTVDIIWAIDNSPSMLSKLVQVQQNLANFMNTIEQSGADVHIVTITLANPAVGTPLENAPEKHRFVPANVFSKLVYSAILDNYAQYEDFLRPDSLTHVVAVTDDQDLMSGADFVTQMEAKLGHKLIQHAIVAGPGELCAAAFGTVYLDAADQTGGEKLSVCSADWTGVFGTLTAAVVEAVPLPCSYDMAEVATLNSTDKYDPTQVAVTYTPAESDESQELGKASSADKCGDQPGWYYDNETDPKTLELCPSACELVKAGGNMAIAFGCEPKIFL
ncbi:MAG TPA: hypothetical protein VFX59_17200 [Polyangiales bacterium]|nr:hypothetical protein [Polyangiales bacterium]